MSKDISNRFAPIRALLESESAHPLLIRHFERAYETFCRNDSGVIPENTIQPVPSLPSLDELNSYEASGNDTLQKTAILKLNGGLGTSMGLDRAKSLLPVKDGLSFLDIIARQTIHWRQATNAQTPLLFMNSFSTRSDTLATLANYPEVEDGQKGVPLDFLQHRVPKILADSGLPAMHPDNPELGWCPPGHGDLYVCLQTTGLLAQLIEHGFHYLFVSNADNLGATLDARIAGYMASHSVPFLMEATARTLADRKGGHLACAPDGHFLLRESAQCPKDETDAFQDISRHKYFNTNNLWIHLPSLKDALAQFDGVLPLPVLVNHKTLDPRDPSSASVVQLETAMGSALGVLPNAQAIQVPRSRFAPVKTTDDLLALRSDCFVMDETACIKSNPQRTLPAIDIQLDPAHYRLIDAFDARFPSGPPSLRECSSLRVQGDIVFGKGVVCRGAVELINETPNPVMLPAETVCEGVQRWER